VPRLCSRMCRDPAASGSSSASLPPHGREHTSIQWLSGPTPDTRLPSIVAVKMRSSACWKLSGEGLLVSVEQSYPQRGPSIAPYPD
jgi:hypothetical protein